MFKVTGTGPAKAKLTPDYSVPIADEQQAANAGTVTWAVSREAQIRSEVTLLYPQDVMTPPATTTGSAGDLDKPQENGSASTTASQAATGDAKIDGILSGVKWAAGITYSDVDSAADYQAGYSSDGDGDGISAQNEGFSQFTAQQTLAMHTALNNATYTQLAAAWGFSIEGFTNLTIDYAGAGAANATIRAANSSDPSTAYAYYPNSNIYGGDTFFGNYYDSSIYTLKNPVAGNYAWHTMLHELGHSLGLKHGQETGGPANVALPYAWDSIEFSVMTYRSYVGAPLSGYTYEQWGAPQTYMMLDIAALQTMYGADYSVQSGDTVYTWSPTTGETYINGGLAIDPGDNRIFATIWDGGGIDTYDLSNYSTNLTLDLNPGGYSVFSNAQLAYLGSSQYARGNIFNALLFNGNTASMIENAIGGSGNDTITGNDLANALTGGSGSDYLSGGKGDDVLDGGDGDDTLLGGDGNDIIDGASGADLIYGGAGNDIIYGGWMDDTVYGEAGDDIFVIRQSLAGTEFGDYTDGGSGTDRLDLSQIATDYSAIVNLGTGTWQYNPLYGGPWTITGVENVDGTQLGDIITGNSGVNVLNGNGGNDSIDGGAGNDIIDGGSGDDTLFGGDGNDIIDGGDGADLIFAGAGNDIIYGSWYTDTVYGEAGNDVFIIRQFGSSTEFGDDTDGGSGTDRLDLSQITTAYGAAVNLDTGSWQYNPLYGGPWTITGVENVDGTQLDDVITGNSSVNVLNGNGGNDTIYGGGGSDTINGGSGNDTIYGDAGNDIINGGSGNDVLIGGDGNDVFDGGDGTDLIYGEGGNDTFLLANGWTGSYGEVFLGGAGSDTFDISAVTGLATSTINLTDGTFTYTPGSSGPISLSSIENVVGSSAADEITGSGEINRLAGLAGNDILFGLGGDDMLDGGAGNDLLDGGTGIDTAVYGGATSAVTVSLAIAAAQATGGAGTDTLTGIENLSGSAYNDTLTGDAGNNVLDGRVGADTMTGGDGNDTYYVDNVGDLVVENSSTGGTDDRVFSSVSYSLTNRTIETLTLTGVAAISATGNSKAQTLNGNDAANTLMGLDGNDVLNGFGGDDTLDGGNGDDSLDGNDGIDTAAYNTATSAVTVSLAVAGAQATGGAGTDTLANIENLIGSAYNDTLTGNSGANVINGKAGSDTMAGGDGNDIYYVDNVGDVITETSTGGSDTVYSSVSYSVSSTYVETLILTGSAAINASGNSHNNSLTGNSGANVIQGGGGNDVLNGGLGADTLSGGSGSDIFVFNSALGGGNVDSITDYSISNDTIRLDDSVFTGLALGALAANAFYVGTAAHDADDRIIYNSSTGALFFDADGNGAGAAIQFATLTTGLPLVASEFVVI